MTPLTIQERDRRWGALRHLMEDVRLDAVVIPGLGTACADARYVTDLPSSAEAPLWVVFPYRTPPLALCRRQRSAGVSAWLDTVVGPRTTYTAATVEVMRDLRLRHRRVGLAGMHAQPTSATPGAPHGLVEALLSAIPGLELVDVSAALQGLRSQKSEEEIALLRQSTHTLDAAFHHMNRVAKPGMYTLELWAAGIGELCRLGGEMPVGTRWASAARPRALSRPAPGLPVPGMVVAAELEAACNGYAVRGAHAIAIRSDAPTVANLYRTVGELWEGALETIRPDVTVGEVQRELRLRAGRLKKPRGPFRNAAAWLALHGAGLGGDAPRLTGRSLSPDEAARVFQEGWAFGLGIWLRADVDGRQYLAGWEDPIVVGASGCTRLGTRIPGHLATGGPADD